MNPQITTLKNGFRIVSEHMVESKSVSIGIWVGTGARAERKNEMGIAHFLEHLAFKGTAKRSSLDIAETIENVGGHINAYTSKEMTAYYAAVLENDLEIAFDVLADILRNTLFRPEDIDAERGVIVQEIGQSLDTPDDVIFDWLQEVAYPEQPMGRNILGTVERINAFQKTDFQKFVDTHYFPANMILSVAGAVEHDKIVKLAESFFGDMPLKERVDFEPAEFIGGEKRLSKEFEQAHFALALPSVSNLDDDRYVAQIYAHALGGGMSSRLFQEVREKRGLCYSIFSSNMHYSDTGVMTIYAGTGSDQLNELVQVTFRELRRIGDDFSLAELDRARAKMKASTLMALESSAYRAERMARLLSIWGYIPTIDEMIEKIDNVNIDMVKRFAQTRCADGRLALALYGRLPSEKIPSVKDLSKSLIA